MERSRISPILLASLIMASISFAPPSLAQQSASGSASVQSNLKSPQAGDSTGLLNNRAFNDIANSDVLTNATINKTGHRYAQAIAGYTTVLNASSLPIGTSRANVLFSRGECFFNIAQYPDAINDFTEALKPDSPLMGITKADVFKMRGEAYLKQKQSKQAIADFTSAIAINPKDKRLYELRSAAYSDAADVPHSLEDKAKAMTP